MPQTRAIDIPDDHAYIFEIKMPLNDKGRASMLCLFDIRIAYGVQADAGSVHTHLRRSAE